MLSVKTPEEVLDLIKSEFAPIAGVQTVSLSAAMGRVLAENIAAEEYVPDFDRSTVDGYADRLVLWIGVKNDGYVTGITVRDLDETFGLGRNTASDVDFLLQYLRSTGDAAVGENIDAITGATITSRAVCDGVNAALACVANMG